MSTSVTTVADANHYGSLFAPPAAAEIAQLISRTGAVVSD